MTLFAYVGCYTTPERNGQGKGINVYRVDPRSGAFKHVQLLGGLENPSFLAVDKTGRFLYSQNFSQDDPWAARAAGAEREQHAHLGEFRPIEMIAAE